MGLLPERGLIVSPLHRILVRFEIATAMFAANEILFVAKHLNDIDGMDIAEDMIEVEYVHFMFDQHEIVFAHGAEVESLYAGPMALHSVSPAARLEFLTLVPELEDIAV